jgi:hypothetical protein
MNNMSTIHSLADFNRLVKERRIHCKIGCLGGRKYQIDKGKLFSLNKLFSRVQSLIPDAPAEDIVEALHNLKNLNQAGDAELSKSNALQKKMTTLRRHLGGKFKQTKLEDLEKRHPAIEKLVSKKDARKTIPEQEGPAVTPTPPMVKEHEDKKGLSLVEKQHWLEELTKNPHSYSSFPSHVKEDPDVTEKAVLLDFDFIAYSPESFKNNPKFIIRMIRQGRLDTQSGMILNWLPQEMRKHPEVCFEAVKRTYNAYKFIDDSLKRTGEIAIRVLEYYSEPPGETNPAEMEIWLASRPILDSKEFLQHVFISVKSTMDHSYKLLPDEERASKSKTYFELEKHVKTELIKNERFMRALIEVFPNEVERVSLRRTPNAVEIIKRAIEIDPFFVREAGAIKKEMVEWAYLVWPPAILPFLDGTVPADFALDKEFLNGLVKFNVFIEKPEELSGMAENKDKSFVLKAIRMNPRCAEFMDPSLQGEEDIKALQKRILLDRQMCKYRKLDDALDISLEYAEDGTFKLSKTEALEIAMAKIKRFPMRSIPRLWHSSQLVMPF